MSRLLVVALALFGLGCSSLDRAKQCRALADAVNPALTSMDVALVAAPVGWAALAQRLQGLAQSLSQVHVDDLKLKQVIGDLSTNFAVARQAALLGVERRGKGGKDDEALEQWVIARNRHANVVRGLEHYCRSR